MQKSLFGDDTNGDAAGSGAPLAARMRPRNLDEFVGQEHLVGPGRALRRAIETDRITSFILWGPPGSGKTTLAQIIANATHAHFVGLSAVSAGVADLRKVIDEADRQRKKGGPRTILLIDEIHRFNKGQQDAVLHAVEQGIVTLIGATTENPSFEVNSALLSRCRVFTLRALKDDEVEWLIRRALEDPERGLSNMGVELAPEARKALVDMADGDARTALNGLELAAIATPPDEAGRRLVTLAAVEDAMQHRALIYDKAGEQHYDIISALHKSMRDSDPDGALYWMARMLEAGEDPLFVARRVVRAASEDVGMADPQALVVAMAAQQAVHFVGMPEGNLALAQAVVYVATAPKSNALYKAYDAVRDDIQKTLNEPVPLHLRNAVTGLMKGLGYGQGYKYAHQYEDHWVDQEHLPPALRGHTYYQPTAQGFEATVAERLRRIAEKRSRTPEAPRTQSDK